ncbi:PH domain-containing protein [bacterium]|nr:PH domain-containing protein [bacterium]
MQKLHPRAIWLFFFSYLLRGLFLGIFFSPFLINFFQYRAMKKFIATPGIYGREFTPPEPSTILVKFLFIFLLLIVVYIIFSYIMARLSYQNWKYELTENAVKIERGVIWKKYVSIPYNRIQNVDIYRGILTRILGLSDLQIQTAGYSGQVLTEGRIPGLEPYLAEKLREELIKKVKDIKQGL